MFRRNQSAFTLIELLIVVAIIAILAAIAVPNFLEAQVRAKVSRVKNDMRTLAVAEEAYYVDYNSYTQGQGGQEGAPLVIVVVWQGLRMLTTPVAYISTLPLDAFGIRSRFGGQQSVSSYEFGVGAVGVGPAGRNPITDRGPGWPADTYELESDGPDRNDNTGGDGPAPSTGSYPTGSWLTISPAVLLGAIYDPTNGTVSTGELFRTGGVPPQGPALQLFYSLGSR